MISRRSLRRTLALLGTVVVALSIVPPVRAELDAQQRFAAGVSAIERGAWDEAIDELEALADRGFVHPDASYDRAGAYVERARTPRSRAGDLGRAAAGLAECLQLRPGDDAARVALDKVREEIARRRARTGRDPVVIRPSLGRAAVGLLPEDFWAGAAAFGSLALTLGLLVRRAVRHGGAHLGGGIAAAVGFVVLLVFGGLAAAARAERTTSQPAVVVVPEARVLDERGVPVPGSAVAHGEIPEGASVEIVERRGNLVRVEWGDAEAWVGATQVRVIARP